MRHDGSRDSEQTLGSVSNALRVLRLLHTEEAVSSASISERLLVGKSTAHRLLTTLASEGFVQRNPAKRAEYIAGPELLVIAASYAGRVDVRRQAHRPMERLCETTGETVSLVILKGNTTRVVDGVESRSTVRVGLRTGVVLPANATAAGKILLAQLGDDEIAALFPQGLPSLTASTTSTWTALRAQLQEIRQRGFAFSAGESETGLHGIAVPVKNHAGATIAALAIAAPHYRLTQRTIEGRARALRDTTLAITQAMG